jgi:AraC-like DNA-binding protein
MTEIESKRLLARLRGQLEVFAFSILRRHPDRKHLFEQLDLLLKQLRASAAADDLDGFHRTDRLFHRGIVESAGLPPLLRSWTMVSEEVDLWILGIKRDCWPNLMDLYREHVHLLDALKTLNETTGSEALVQHLESGWHRRQIALGMELEDAGPVLRAASYLATHYVSAVKVAWLARHVCFVSEAHLIRRFRQQFGVTPHAYLQRQRLEKARMLLRTSRDPVAAIAAQVGFRNASHFTRCFRESYAVAPLAFRRKCQKTNR